MSASLCIEVSSTSKKSIEEIVFFEAGEWTQETEKELLLKMQDLLSAVRNICNSFSIKISVQADDIQAALFQIKKKAAAHVEVNHQKLSIREIEILGLIMQGLTNNEIAAKLFVSYETVKSHRKHILEKTAAKNTAALINYYHQTFFEK
jgi:DNA-binding CsgD family transcriptional regulator